MPPPLPVLDTANAYVGICRVKVAFTTLSADIDTVHAPVPEQAPLQPAKVDPEAGVAVNVTDKVELKAAVQAEPQLIPAGLLVTVPLPVPSLVIMRF